MTPQSKSSSKHHRRGARNARRQHATHDKHVHLITGASESIVADSERKNRTYAMLIGVRILSLFVVLFTDGWVQIVVFVGGMLAPWIGVQLANNIRQVSNTPVVEMPEPHQAAIAAATRSSDGGDDDTVIVGDFIVEDDARPTTPSAESSDNGTRGDQNEKDHDDSRS